MVGAVRAVQEDQGGREKAARGLGRGLGDKDELILFGGME